MAAVVATCCRLVKSRSARKLGLAIIGAAAAAAAAAARLSAAATPSRNDDDNDTAVRLRLESGGGSSARLKLAGWLAAINSPTSPLFELHKTTSSGAHKHPNGRPNCPSNHRARAAAASWPEPTSRRAKFTSGRLRIPGEPRGHTRRQKPQNHLLLLFGCCRLFISRIGNELTGALSDRALTFRLDSSSNFDSSLALGAERNAPARISPASFSWQLLMAPPRALKASASRALPVPHSTPSRVQGANTTPRATFQHRRAFGESLAS